MAFENDGLYNLPATFCMTLFMRVVVIALFRIPISILQMVFYTAGLCTFTLIARGIRLYQISNVLLNKKLVQF